MKGSLSLSESIVTFWGELRVYQLVDNNVLSANVYVCMYDE